MPNNQQLPQPNLPKQPSSSGQSQPQQTQPNSVRVAGSKVAQSQSQSAPAGLDRFAPGGAPPKGTTQNNVGRLADPKPAAINASSGQSSQSEQASSGMNVTQATKLSQQQLAGKKPPQNIAQSRLNLPPSARPPSGGLTSTNLNQVTQPKQPRIGGAPPTLGGTQKDGGSDKDQPIFAQTKSLSKKKMAFIGGGVVVVGLVAFLAVKLFSGGLFPAKNSVKPSSPGSDESNSAANNGSGANEVVPSQEAVLTYWGLWEPGKVLEEVFAEFENQNPGIQVDYRKQSPKDYRERLQNAIASGNGPDLFRYHATWVPMLSQELASLPNKIMSPAEFKKAFYPVMSEQLQWNGQIVGLPLMYDGLGLYYNKDILKTVNEQPPTTWGELRILADKLTVRTGGKVERGGLAIGNASNTEHFSDILGLLILQNGGDPAQPMSSEVRDAIKFYASFMTDQPVYSNTLPSSSVAFAREEVAMIFAPSWRVFEIRNLNPDLNFGITSVPKLSESQLAWASYWAEGVSDKSKNQDAAWKLLKYLSSEEVLKQLHSQQSKIRAFGEMYPRPSMAGSISNELVSPFLEDAPQASSWYLCSKTHDNGLNDRVIKYYEDAINSVLEGKNVEKVLPALKQGVDQVLRQYNADE